MRQIMRKIVLFVAFSMMTIVAGYAQGSSSVQLKVNDIVKRYENVKGVECISVTKGEGLGMVKMMLNTQFGKDFMAGVTSITIIDYSEASQATCLAIRKDVDIFKTILEEFDMSDSGYTDKEYIRSFAKVENSTTLSDFMIAIEDGESKMIMYMAGKIKAK